MNEKVPTCPACREPITQKKRSRCLACGKELHRWCASVTPYGSYSTTGIEAVMDNFEKYGIWTPEGEIVIDDVGEDADELTVSIAYSLAMMCGAGELVRIPVEEQANEPQEIPGA